MYRLWYKSEQPGIMLYASLADFLRIQGHYMRIGPDGLVYWLPRNSAVVGRLIWEDS